MGSSNLTAFLKRSVTGSSRGECEKRVSMLTLVAPGSEPRTAERRGPTASSAQHSPVFLPAFQGVFDGGEVWYQEEEKIDYVDGAPPVPARRQRNKPWTKPEDDELASLVSRCGKDW